MARNRYQRRRRRRHAAVEPEQAHHRRFFSLHQTMPSIKSVEEIHDEERLTEAVEPQRGQNGHRRESTLGARPLQRHLYTLLVIAPVRVGGSTR